MFYDIENYFSDKHLNIFLFLKFKYSVTTIVSKLNFE